MVSDKTLPFSPFFTIPSPHDSQLRDEYHFFSVVIASDRAPPSPSGTIRTYANQPDNARPTQAFYAMHILHIQVIK